MCWFEAKTRHKFEAKIDVRLGDTADSWNNADWSHIEAVGVFGWLFVPTSQIALLDSYH